MRGYFSRLKVGNELDINRIHEFATKTILEAGTRIHYSLRKELLIETKSNVNDFVTNIDRETEAFFVEKIKQFDSSHKILGEEGMGDRIVTLDGPLWIIDPIDGTMNFIKQHRHFMITIGFYVDGIGQLGYIYDVMRGELMYAINGKGAYLGKNKLNPLEPLTINEAIIGINSRWVLPNEKVNHEKIVELIKTVRGTRSYGSAAMEISFVSSGKLDAYISMQLAPWDIGGGLVIAKEVGAKVTNLKGEPANILKEDTFIIANPSIHQILLERFIELK